MSEATHTSAPWHVQHDDEVWTEAGSFVASAANEEIARLIAAAPELLDAAEAVFGVTEANELPKRILDALSEAIAKARGEA